jgi:malate dehydrogenase (oxaloacetate-decarboxylating)(NADP+)
MTTTPDKHAELRQASLDYHEHPTPGKVAISASKQLTNQRDLALAYTPGVAAVCEEIVASPANAFRYTSRGNLVAVITNGTAVLGLGNIGPLAAKPVMEGKAVLFKKFAGIGGGIAIGPILLGAAQPVHILTPSATVRRIVNMTALTVAEINAPR